MTEGEFPPRSARRKSDPGELVSDSESAASELLSPLHPLHVEGGASFTDFAGWQMPVRYTSDLAEHHAVRNSAGIFDISHMAEIAVSGENAAAFLDYALAGKLSSLKLTQAKYSLLLNDNGGIIDDLIVYRTADDEFLVVANAGNHDPVVAALTERVSGFAGASVEDVSARIALIAVQGPNALPILEGTAGLAIADGQQDLAGLKYYWSTTARFNGRDLFIGRTGYTGEDGFELYVDVADAAELWRALTLAGASHGLVLAGLASRDTLRLEAGMPLYGHELGVDILPVQAGLGRVVSLAKENDFVGRTAIEAGPAADAPVLVGLVSEGRRAGRAGYALFLGDREIGTITSGALSPTLGRPIAMAFVAPDAATPGTEITIDVRGTRIPAIITPLPFYSREKK